jgi:acyl carrier protein
MTATERIVAMIFCEILELEAVGPEDDLFELGGDSLQAVQIALRLETRFGVDLQVETLEVSGRVGDIAQLIDQALLAAAPC